MNLSRPNSRPMRCKLAFEEMDWRMVLKSPWRVVLVVVIFFVLLVLIRSRVLVHTDSFVPHEPIFREAK